MQPTVTTHFDSPERSSPEAVATLNETVTAFPAVVPLLEGFPSAAVLLDRNRQIVAFNARSSGVFVAAEGNPLGRRFGEAIGCVHADEMPGGCGTSKHCKECGNAKAIRFTRDRRHGQVSECRISAKQDGRSVPIDIRVYTSPVDLGGEPLTLLSIEDIAHEKRRAALERVFFDEVGHAATAVEGAAELIGGLGAPDQLRQVQAMLSHSARHLAEAIEGQRDLVAAENGELPVTIAATSVNTLLERVSDAFAESPLAQDRRFLVERLGEDVIVETDLVQASRAFGNLVKNALEAASPGDVVKVWATGAGTSVALQVSNPQVMPESVQLQVFQRSFSSKGASGRGIGTYSARLVAEEYLRGEVSFVSNDRFGTVFSMHLPLPEAGKREETVRLDDLLVRAGLISPEDLRIARGHTERHLVGLSEAVVELGFVREEDAYRTLARACRLPYVDIDAAALDPAPIKLVPERVARRHSVVPLRDDGRSISYAVARPYDDEADRDVAFVSGRRTHRVVARPSQILQALDRFFPARSDFDQLLDRVRREAPRRAHEWSLTQTGSPVIELCNRLIAHAVELNASDIHMEPTDQAFVVRYRVGGVMEQAFELPAEVAPAATNRLKIMAGADIFVRMRPQDGAFRTTADGRDIDVRLSTLPTIHGEKIVMRVIDAQLEMSVLNRLGYDTDNLDRLRRALSRPDGLVLVTGPTGSGKTTVLYAALNHLRTGRTNIVTVEDPVERRIEGVNQIAVNNRGGATFAAVLRSVLRQDPNVIMVGEIRDAEVAQIVGQAAFTGHLVLSSVHASDAASAITRLLNLGLEPFKIAESLAAVVAQRLVRRLCPQCVVSLPDADAKKLGAAHGLRSIPVTVGPGCDACKGTGYAGRTPVVEVLVATDIVQAAIAEGATAARLRTAMRTAGCLSMRDSALSLVAQGVTSLEDVNRVLVDETPNVAPARAKRTVLVADADMMVRLLVRTLLEHEGFEVVEADTGPKAIELARASQPSMAIVDVRIPDMDGYVLIETLRREPALTGVPVIVLTSDTGGTVQQRALDAGADDYLVKPFEREVLTARVRALFRRLERVAT